MIYKKRGRWEMVINSEIDKAKRKPRVIDDEELRRGRIRRAIEDRRIELEAGAGDLW